MSDSERLTDDEVRRMLLYCETVKDSMYRVEVFANWQIKAMRELLDLRAENARLRGAVMRFGTLLTEDRDADDVIVGINAPESYLSPGDDGYDDARWLLSVEYAESEGE